MSIDIVLADDHKIVRDGLRALIEQQPDMKVVAEAEEGWTTLEKARKFSPDVVIMDIGMPDLNGIDATRQILSEMPDVKVIALSMHSDRGFVADMLRAGALGYLLKDCAFEELTCAIHTVIESRIYLSPEITDVVVEDYVYHLSKADLSGSSVLTPREREVLQLMSEGKTTSQIASRLNVSTKTIDTHRQQIMERLNLHSIAELTKYAIRAGLTFLER